jgi:predicted nucleotidyltransferase
VKVTHSTLKPGRDFKAGLAAPEAFPPSLQAVVTALRTLDPERIFVIGSWARGEADELSDLDLVVIQQTTQPFLERLRAVANLLPVDVGAVDVLVYTPEEFAAMRRDENAFAQTVCEEGVLVYARETAS